MKVLLFFGAPTLFLGVLRSLCEIEGVRVGGVFRSHDSRTARVSKHLRRCFEVPPGATEEDELTVIESAIRDFVPDVVMAVCDRAHELLARHRERLARLPCGFVAGVGISQLLDARDKRRLSFVLSSWRIAHPLTFRLEEVPELKELAGRWLLKPANLNGGKGIRLFESGEDLCAHLAAARPDPKEHVVQQWVEGDILNCNVLCRKGRILASTVHCCLDPGKGFLPHYAMQFVDDGEVVGLVARLMEALDWNGLANLDLIREKSTGRLVILELNARAWASLLSSTAAGVNFPWLACRLALGHEPEPMRMKPIRFRMRLPAWTQMLGAWTRLSRPPYGFRETDLPYVLKDPAPELKGLLLHGWRLLRDSRRSP